MLLMGSVSKSWKLLNNMRDLFASTGSVNHVLVVCRPVSNESTIRQPIKGQTFVIPPAPWDSETTTPG